MRCANTAFRLECEMTEPLLAFFPSLLGLRSGQRAKVLFEPTIGSVIPDILVGIWSGDLPRYRGLNAVSRHILAWLSAQKVASGEAQLREELFISHNAAASAVSALKRIGAVAQRESGEVELCAEFHLSNSVKLIAIEIKLRRWREALAQAISYRQFADKAYVALDGNQVKVNADMRAVFATHGIGLLMQRGPELKCEIAAIDCAKPAPSVDRLFAVSKLDRAGPYCLA
jgi:hypothetical protein